MQNSNSVLLFKCWNRASLSFRYNFPDISKLYEQFIRQKSIKLEKKPWLCLKKRINCHSDVRTCQGRRRPAQSGLRAQGHQGHTHHCLMSAPPLFWSSLASQRITSARPRQDNHKCEYWIFLFFELNQLLLGKYLWYRFHTFQDTWRWLERDTVWDREARHQSRGGGGKSGHRIRACDQSEDRITWGWPIRKREDGWSERWEIR